MMKVDYKNFEIEVIDDQNYDLNSSHNSYQYQKFYFDENEFHSSSKHAIIIREHGIEVSSAIICEGGGATGINDKSFITEDNKIWIIVSNKIYCLKIPSLEIIWHKQFDEFTNFRIYRLNQDFLIHGELEIFRITKEGEIIWSFGGRDIWVNPEGKAEFTIENDFIRLFDFESNEYIIDFNGKELEFNSKTIPE
jgi:hypothetical protein